jgi:hypothetical protein
MAVKLHEKALLLIPTEWLIKAMLWCGKQIFTLVKTWSPKEGALPRVLHFAYSDSDFNCACRQHVEYLDEVFDARLRLRECECYKLEPGFACEGCRLAKQLLEKETNGK